MKHVSAWFAVIVMALSVVLTSATNAEASSTYRTCGWGSALNKVTVWRNLPTTSPSQKEIVRIQSNQTWRTFYYTWRLQYVTSSKSRLVWRPANLPSQFYSTAAVATYTFTWYEQVGGSRSQIVKRCSVRI